MSAGGAADAGWWSRQMSAGGAGRYRLEEAADVGWSLEEPAGVGWRSGRCRLEERQMSAGGTGRCRLEETVDVGWGSAVAARVPNCRRI